MTIASAIDVQRDRIARAALSVGRAPTDITLVAVSKMHPVQAVQEALQAGIADFGESYVKDWLPKADALGDSVNWHFIGHLQANKAKQVVGRAALIHSVDRLSLLQALGGEREASQGILLQLNLTGEASKSGCHPDQWLQLLEQAARTPGIALHGLMTMGDPGADEKATRQVFAQLRELLDVGRQYIAAESPTAASHFRHLSMGMSDDLEWAVQEGATLVRVGTAIFGART